MTGKPRIGRGMTVRISGDLDAWTVLDRHPEQGHWWLHRWRNGVWETTYARHNQLTQVFGGTK